jgi:transposase
MYLRKHRKVKKSGEGYEYWTLVETVRTARGPRQRIVGNLGKLPGLDAEERLGWEEIGRVLSGRPRECQPGLFVAEPEPPEWACVDLHRVKAERLRRFGDAYLALAVWKRLGLDELLQSIVPADQAEIGWEVLACLLVLARFCEPSSELAIAEHFYGTTALDDLLGLPPDKVNDDRLYRALDALLPHKDALCKHLLGRYAEWFGTRVDFLLYDVTSTYFEGRAEDNTLAALGYSRDHRSDCRQVCIGLVVTPEGLPVGYEVFAGNRADVTTLEQMIALLENRYGQARRIWVFDRGIVSEENLAELRARGARYVVGTPKSMLRRFEAQLLEDGWEQAAASGVEVKSVAHPDLGTDSFILCRSPQRREKERAILTKQAERLEAKLTAVQTAIRSGRLRDRGTAERRIGRWLGKFTRAEDLFHVELLPAAGPLTDLRIEKRRAVAAWAALAQGAYLLRSNVQGEEPARLWQWYIQLTQAEAAFRLTKGELGLRPVYHRRTDRVEAHILVCFLALVLWRSLEQWLKAKGLGTCARRLVAEMKEVRSLDIVLEVKDRGPVRLRAVGQPEKPLQQLLQRLGLPLPNRPRRIGIVKNVVQTSS